MWQGQGVRIWRSIDEVPPGEGRTVVTIGNFDGVHRGHRHVIGCAREEADREGTDRVVAVTFEPHPMAVLRPDHAPVMLTDLDTRVRLLADAGADDVLVLSFDREVAAWSPEHFIDRILVRALRARAVVVGANFRFGAKAAGDVATLREVGAREDFTVTGVELDGGPQVWSSTYVRSCLAAGDVAGAAEALGRWFAVSGTVAHGDQRGQEIGFPTVNVPTPTELAVPADGVYAGWLVPADTGEEFPAAISVGTNPTFTGVRDRRVEAYVLGRDDLALYDRDVQVRFVAHLRGMVQFEGAAELVAEMRQDVRRAAEILGVTPP